jgi:hypothetical protein
MNITSVSHSIFEPFDLGSVVTLSVSLSQNLIFTQTVNTLGLFLKSLSNSLTFTQNTESGHTLPSLPLHLTSFNQTLGLNQTIIATFGIVYEVVEVGNIEFVTTSGKLGVVELDDLINIIISNYNKRLTDWVITWLNTVVAIIHTNNTVTYI